MNYNVLPVRALFTVYANLEENAKEHEQEKLYWS